MALRYDIQLQQYVEYCDTFKDDKCSRCAKPMSKGIGTTKCGHQSAK